MDVRDTTEFRRVLALPRRPLSERDAAAWAAVFTGELRLPGSRAALRPWQGFSIAEALACRGAFLGLGVGHGKTLISFLLPTALKSLRPLLIVPAALREKTYADFGAYATDWRSPRTHTSVIGREELAPERGAMLLEQIQPDLIMVDECDEFANPKSSAVRRLDRYIVAHEDAVVVLMTGTPGRKSIMNYWHLLCWALRDRAPVPLHRGEAEAWAMALDEGRGRNPTRVDVGPLGHDRGSARAWFKKRLVETPGVVIVDGDSCQAPLTVRVRLAREDKTLDDAFEKFLKTQETPDGIPVSDPLSRWRADGQLGCGLYLRWNPPPPTAWRDARRAVAKFVRDRIAHSTHTARPLDTEAQVLKRFEDHPIVRRWQAIRGTFEPITEAVWVSDSPIQSVRDWLGESSAPGIVWSGCTEFGEACARATRLPYYGPEGRDTLSKRGLHEADTRRGMVASWHANKRGFNLQAWTRQLVVMPPQSAKYLEQIFGRSHRAGQDEHVTIDVLATSGGTLDAFETAIKEAGFARDTVGLTQKILRADVVRAAPRITRSNMYRWARKTHDVRKLVVDDFRRA